MAATAQMPDTVTYMALYAGVCVAIGVALRIEPSLGIGIRDVIAGRSSQGPALSPGMVRRLKKLEVENRQLIERIGGLRANVTDAGAITNKTDIDTLGDAASVIVANLRRKVIKLEADNNRLKRGDNEARSPVQVPENIPSDVRELQTMVSRMRDELADLRAKPGMLERTTLILDANVDETHVAELQGQLENLRKQQLEDDSRELRLKDLSRKEREAEDRLAKAEEEQKQAAEELAKKICSAKGKFTEMEKREAEARARVIAMEQKIATRRQAEKAVADRIDKDKAKLGEVLAKIKEAERQQRRSSMDSDSADSTESFLPEVYDIETQLLVWQEDEAALKHSIEEFAEMQGSLKTDIQQLLEDGRKHAIELQRIEALQEKAQLNLNSLRTTAMEARNEVEGLKLNIRQLQEQRVEYEAELEQMRVRVMELRDQRNRIRQEVTKATGQNQHEDAAALSRTDAEHEAEMERKNKATKVFGVIEARITSLAGIRRQEAQLELLEDLLARVRAVDQLLARRPSQALEFNSIVSQMEGKNRDLLRNVEVALEQCDNARAAERRAIHDFENYRRSMEATTAGAEPESRVKETNELCDRIQGLQHENQNLRDALAERERELARVQDCFDRQVELGLTEERQQQQFRKHVMMLRLAQAELRENTDTIGSLREETAQLRAALEVAQDKVLRKSTEPGTVALADEVKSLREYCRDAEKRLVKANGMIGKRARQITYLQRQIAVLEGEAGVEDGSDEKWEEDSQASETPKPSAAPRSSMSEDSSFGSARRRSSNAETSSAASERSGKSNTESSDAESSSSDDGSDAESASSAAESARGSRRGSGEQPTSAPANAGSSSAGQSSAGPSSAGQTSAGPVKSDPPRAGQSNAEASSAEASSAEASSAESSDGE